MDSTMEIVQCEKEAIDGGNTYTSANRPWMAKDDLARAKPFPNENTKLLNGEEVNIATQPPMHLNKRRLGFVALFGLIWSNIFQAESVQWLQGPVNFKKTFFTMCFSHAAPVLLLPLMLVYCHLCSTREGQDGSVNPYRVLQRYSSIPLPRFLRLSAFFGVFYLISDYFWFSSFKNLSVATGAAVFNSSPLFVYCFSICLLHEKASTKKLFGVLTAFAGVTMVVMNQGGTDTEHSAGGSSILGAMMMLTAAAMNAVFEVTLSLFAGEDMNNISTLLAFSGLCGMFAIPPWFIGTIFFANSPIPSLHEEIGLPTTEEGMLMLTIAVVMFVINFVCFSLAICWTSPLEASVGFMVTIPLSGVMDIFIHHATFSWEFMVGSTLVMAGFGILELSTVRLQL